MEPKLSAEEWVGIQKAGGWWRCSEAGNTHAVVTSIISAHARDADNYSTLHEGYAPPSLTIWLFS